MAGGSSTPTAVTHSMGSSASDRVSGRGSGGGGAGRVPSNGVGGGGSRSGAGGAGNYSRSNSGGGASRGGSRGSGSVSSRSTRRGNGKLPLQQQPTFRKLQKKMGRRHSSIDPEVLKREARAAALEAAVDARALGMSRVGGVTGGSFATSITSRGGEMRGSAAAAPPLAPASASASAAAAAAAHAVQASAPPAVGVESAPPRSSGAKRSFASDGEAMAAAAAPGDASVDSKDQAVFRGTLLASKAAGERDNGAAGVVVAVPTFDDDGSEDLLYFDADADVDLSSVADTTLPSVRTRTTSPPTTARSLSAISEDNVGVGGGGNNKGGGKGGTGGRRPTKKYSFEPGVDYADDRHDVVVVGGGTSPKKRQRRRKMAFPRTSILKIKVKRRHKDGMDGDSSAGGSSKVSLFSWMSPTGGGGRRNKRQRPPKKKKKIQFGEDETVEYTVLTETRDATEDAWMCGLCGMAFSRHELAEAHEVRCVRYAFGTGDVRMGYLPTLIDGDTRKGNGFLAGGAGGVGGTAAAMGNGGGDNKPLPLATDHGGSLSPLHRKGRDFPKSAPPRPRANSDTLCRASDAQHHGAAGPLSGRAVDVNGGGSSLDDGGTRYEIRTARTAREPGAIHLSNSMRRCVVMTDEAVCKVARRASMLVLALPESDAERELALLARDRKYYDLLATRSADRHNGSGRTGRGHFGRGDKSVMGKIRGRFEEAYRLIKEEDVDAVGRGAVDVYNAKGNKRSEAMPEIAHNDGTLYLNVVVKNGAQVINHELERLAKMRWENEQAKAADGAVNMADALAPRKEFEWFRQFAQLNIVRLAGLALASDFTPRRIAIQLSNDLYRLMGPRLKKRGVTIETEIEYRVGAYFVLGINIKEIDWIALMRYTHREVEVRKRDWKIKQEEKELTEAAASKADGGGGGEKEEEKQQGDKPPGWRFMWQLYIPTKLELIAQCLSWLHRLHWIISLPICLFWYSTFLRDTMREYIVAGTTDDIFQYVERKGMEMEMRVCEAYHQASFMLSALRELRSDERELKKKKEEAEKGEDGAKILGALLGPEVKEDKGGASPPAGWAPPENLEDVNLEMELPVGFRRLRWALLSKDSKFMAEAVYKEVLKYENIVIGEWSNHHEHIGLPNPPAGVKESDFIDVSKDSEYLMPKSAFVKANMCYEHATIEEYNDHCFALHNVARNPEVPYGTSFLAHTKLIFTNQGNNHCSMVCSVEAEFPNGPPMIARQIKSGMRAGTAEVFVSMGETICRYADEYP